MTGRALARLFAWTIALVLVALPIVGVLNGWFASDRWPVTQLTVSAEFSHVSAEQIRAAVQPLLGQGFFAMRLGEVRDAVAKLPWVERVEVRKQWPDTVDLVVYEQRPYAHWGEDRLVNRDGKLFAVAGATDLQGLPRLSGPDDRLDDVLRFYVDGLREFSGSGLSIDTVALSARGGWRLGLGSGTVVELGRERARERLKRFLDVWPQLVGAHSQGPAYVDLRYANGFAVRWAQPVAEPPAAGNGESGTGNGEKPPLAGAWHARSREGLAARLSELPIPNLQSRLSRISHPESPIPAPP